MNTEDIGDGRYKEICSECKGDTFHIVGEKGVPGTWQKCTNCNCLWHEERF